MARGIDSGLICLSSAMADLRSSPQRTQSGAEERQRIVYQRWTQIHRQLSLLIPPDLYAPVFICGSFLLPQRTSAYSAVKCLQRSGVAVGLRLGAEDAEELGQGIV